MVLAGASLAQDVGNTGASVDQGTFLAHCKATSDSTNAAKNL